MLINPYLELGSDYFDFQKLKIFMNIKNDRKLNIK